jgi:uncharacterized protein YacL
MVAFVVRALFLAVGAGVGSLVAGELSASQAHGIWFGMGGAAVLVLLEMLATGKVQVSVISSIVFGLLAGAILATVFTQALVLLPGAEGDIKKTEKILRLILTAVFCYICVAILIKTRDNFHFIIPYTEFKKQEKGPKPLLLDTSAIIDGRIADVLETNILSEHVIVPRFIILELQQIADSSDKLKRVRGRRGLDILARLQKSTKADVAIIDATFPGDRDADSQLVRMAGNMNGRIVTCDFNLNKVAQLEGLDTINLNDVANALRPVVLPGEHMEVKVIKPGEETDQGVGYLDDGTMVVVERGRSRIGHSVQILVTSVLQTSAGRMIFGRIE